MKKITTFWSWFSDNRHTIKNWIHETPQNQEKICYWIHKNLSYYCSEIDFIIVFPKKPSKQAEFIITSNGNQEYICQLIDLIDNAPVLKNWKFTAFIKPQKAMEKKTIHLDQACIIQNISLKSDDLKSLPLNQDATTPKQKMVINMKNNHVICYNESLNQAIFFILQDLMGKNIPFQQFNLVQLAKLPDIPEENLIHLCDLQLYIDSYPHITTNLSASEIETAYGNRVRSRMRNMLNLIAFDKTTKDKR